MKKAVLFSVPDGEILAQLKDHLFFKPSTKFAYMPADVSLENNEKYANHWQNFCEQNGGTFIYIDNTIPDDANKIASTDTLLITGGNTFKLMYYLRKNGFIEAIKSFVEKDDFVISGFSAGVVILCPKIDIVTQPWDVGSDIDEFNLETYEGLSILPFEVLPHYNPKNDNELLEQYARNLPYQVKTIRNDQLIVEDLE